MIRVRNYYLLKPEELEHSLFELRDWLFDYPHHEKFNAGVFALDVALSAQDLKRDEEIDLFIKHLT